MNQADQLRLARGALQDWFATNARVLPWRKHPDPYAIWVSEIMLQQTQVKTVLRYFDPFLNRFPTVASLAKAAEDDVLSAWQGLGYYRRARLLHRGAKYVNEMHKGVVPRDAAERLKIPGVGKYTNGAIGSFAFDQPEPIVDGNVARVLSRMFRVFDTLGTKTSDKTLWSLAAKYANGNSPSTANEALMELGATVCTPQQPSCQRCPIDGVCGAFANDEVALLPTPKVRVEQKKEPRIAYLATRDDEVALSRVPEDQPFAGLWMLPMHLGDAPEIDFVRDRFGSGAGIDDTSITTVKHTLTHRKITMRVHRVLGPTAPALTWSTQPIALPHPNLLTKVLDAVNLD